MGNDSQQGLDKQGLNKNAADSGMIGLRLTSSTVQSGYIGLESGRSGDVLPARKSGEHLSHEPAPSAGQNDRAGISKGLEKRAGLSIHKPPGFATIGQIARKHSVSLRALRFYEDRGLLQPLRRGRRRFYDKDQDLRLQMILRGKRLGFTLTEISKLIADTGKTAGAEFEAMLKPGRILKQIDELVRQRDSLDVAIGELRQTRQRIEGDDNDGSASAA